MVTLLIYYLRCHVDIQHKENKFNYYFHQLIYSDFIILIITYIIIFYFNHLIKKNHFSSLIMNQTLISFILINLDYMYF